MGFLESLIINISKNNACVRHMGSTVGFISLFTILDILLFGGVFMYFRLGYVPIPLNLEKCSSSGTVTVKSFSEFIYFSDT